MGDTISVLVAVHDVELSKSYCQAIESLHDYDAVPVHTVMEMLHILSEDRLPDIFVLDLSLNGDKFDPCTVLNLLLTRTHMPIFVLGTNLGREDEERLFLSGAWNVLNKPVSSVIVQAFVQRYKNYVLNVRERDILREKVSALEDEAVNLRKRLNIAYYLILALSFFVVRDLSIGGITQLIDFFKSFLGV